MLSLFKELYVHRLQLVCSIFTARFAVALAAGRPPLGHRVELEFSKFLSETPVWNAWLSRSNG
jgi:hypothetical protein